MLETNIDPGIRIIGPTITEISKRLRGRVRYWKNRAIGKSELCDRLLDDVLIEKAKCMRLEERFQYLIRMVEVSQQIIVSHEISKVDKTEDIGIPIGRAKAVILELRRRGFVP